MDKNSGIQCCANFLACLTVAGIYGAFYCIAKNIRAGLAGDPHGNMCMAFKTRFTG
jgi:hypothetical protein